MPVLKAVGLMSGTSLDGVDVALLETDGESVVRAGPIGYRPYTEEERALLRTALADAAVLTDRTARPGSLREAEALITLAHAEAVEAFLAGNKLSSQDIAVIGFHGQTVLHRPQSRLTVQIGDGTALAKRLGVRIVFDFRAADVAAGGQGAPLVPVFHQALACTLDLPRPLAVVNIGGVANITYLDGDNDPIAFDTGPGNAPIDDLVLARTGESHDRGGKLAAHGTVKEEIIARILADPYFARKPPKSLDRAAFARLPLDQLSNEDAAATATAVAATGIAHSQNHLPKTPATWIIAGGGAHNPALVAMLGERLRRPILRADEIGWSSHALEAQAFAYLAVRSLKGLPITFPTTTGAPKPMTGGVVANP
jgi:anhydro-N-acetylmuramic acid kinase